MILYKANAEMERELNEIGFIETDKTIEEETIRYLNICSVLKTVAISVLILNLLMLATRSPYYIQALAVTYIMIVIYFLYRRYNVKKIRSYILKECDTIKFLSVIRVFIVRTKSRRSLDDNFYNIVNGLILSGEDELAEKYLKLMESYCNDGYGRLAAQIMKMDLCLFRMDFDGIVQGHAELERLKQSCGLKASMRNNYLSRISYLNVAGLWLSKQYEAFIYAVEHPAIPPRFNLGNLKIHYYAYLAEKAMGRENAEFHRNFVLNYGGTTWYRKAVMAM